MTDILGVGVAEILNPFVTMAGAYSTVYYVLDDLGTQIPVYPVEALLPPQNDDRVLRIIKDLQDSDVYNSSDERWKCCPIDPAQLEPPGTDVFEFLIEIVKQIGARCTETDLGSHLEYNPNKNPKSRALNTSRPDFCFTMVDYTAAIDWSAVSVPVEVKKMDKAADVEDVSLIYD